MSSPRIKVNYQEVGKQLLRSEWTQSVIEEVAQGVADRAGDGYEIRTHNTGQRLITNVYAATDEAAQDNLDNNTLLYAIGG